MCDLAAAKDALAALENGDDRIVVRDALKALAALTKSLKRRLKTPTRRRKGEGALVFREDKKLYQFEVELPRGPDGKRRRRVVYGKTAEETRRKVADLRLAAVVACGRSIRLGFPNTSPPGLKKADGDWRPRRSSITCGPGTRRLPLSAGCDSIASIAAESSVSSVRLKTAAAAPTRSAP